MPGKHRYPGHPRGRDDTLRIASANVNRCNKNHTATLQAAFEQNIDILLIQEPWIHKREPQRRITKWADAFETLLPVSDWTINNPRVMTYIRRERLALQATTDPSFPEHPDVMAVNIAGVTHGAVRLFNVYNAGRGSERAGEAATLLRTHGKAEEAEVYAGDFNMHHENWSLSSSPTTWEITDEWVKHCEDRDIHLVSNHDVPTHRRGGVLDLVWMTNRCSSRQAIRVRLAPELNGGSDHQPMRIDMEKAKPKEQQAAGRFRLDTLDSSLFEHLLKEGLPALTDALSHCEEGDATEAEQILDELAESITRQLKTALELSTKRTNPKARGQPFWNQELREAAKERRRIRGRNIAEEGDDVREADKKFRKLLHKVRGSHFSSLIANVSDSKDLFKMAKWGNSTGRFGATVLKDPQGKLHVSATERAELLRSTHLPNDRSAEDIEPMPSRDPRENWKDVTRHEVEQAMLHAKNTAPGEDEIAPNVYKRAWPFVGELITRFFQVCLRRGYHPKPFRSARICVINKTGNRDRHSPRSYRLISLLSVLGKGLERIVARRLSWVATTKRIIPKRYYGAVPVRSASDLLTDFMDEVETKQAAGHAVSALTIDIKGAFDAVLPGRLVQRLYDQRWPHHAVRWVASFLRDRTAAVVLPGHVQDSTRTAGSLPQGSPVSPILFMLFLAPLMRRKLNASRVLPKRGYADDIMISAFGAAETNVKLLSQELDDTIRWCRHNGLDIDQGKSGLIHLVKRVMRTDANPSIPPHASRRGPPLWTESIEATGENETLRWLGINFDRRCNFAAHAAIVANRGKRVVNGIRMLGGCYKGTSANLLLSVAKACVLPTMTYASTAWWKPNRTNKDWMKRVIDPLERTWRAALRAAIPVYRTTATTTLHHFAGVPPAELYLDRLSRAHALRVYRLDPRHALTEKRKELALTGSVEGRSRLARTLRMLPGSCEEANPLRAAPWSRDCDPRVREEAMNPAAGHRGRKAQAEAFKCWKASLPAGDVVLGTDGSKLKDGRTGGGWIAEIIDDDRGTISGYNGYGQHAEVFDAEARAVRDGLRAMNSNGWLMHRRRLWVCLDNQSVITRITTPSSRSLLAQEVFLEIAALSRDWETRDRGENPRGEPPPQVRFKWVPGHAGVSLNESADRLANEGANLPLHRHANIVTLAGGKRWLKETMNEEFKTWWSRETANYPSRRGITTGHSQELIPLEQPKVQKLPNIPRMALAVVFAARSGHGDFATYHSRFLHHGTSLHCTCGALKSRLHFYSCRSARDRNKLKFFENKLILLDELITTVKGAMCIGEWMKTSGYKPWGTIPAM
jgi:ribonuclease HI/endonuclease/exonuclease/phosphatase family metal-dependent hydrolase